MRAALISSLLLTCIAGCGSRIGDSCTTNVDCSPFGDRFCDTSAMNGYCTQEGCDNEALACPSEAVCIRFFTSLADEQCTYDGRLDQADCPHVDDYCVCDQTVDGVCMGSVGHCAPASTERRWCQRSCSSNGDCRSGYECRATGTFGAEPLPTFDQPNGTPAKFCAPSAMAF